MNEPSNTPPTRPTVQAFLRSLRTASDSPPPCSSFGTAWPVAGRLPIREPKMRTMKAARRVRYTIQSSRMRWPCSLFLHAVEISAPWCDGARHLRESKLATCRCYESHDEHKHSRLIISCARTSATKRTRAMYNWWVDMDSSAACFATAGSIILLVETRAWLSHRLQCAVRARGLTIKE